jgi:hypothetical protein
MNKQRNIVELNETLFSGFFNFETGGGHAARFIFRDSVIDPLHECENVTLFLCNSQGAF